MIETLRDLEDELPREVFEQVVTLLLPNSNNLALSFAYFDSLAVV